MKEYCNQCTREQGFVIGDAQGVVAPSEGDGYTPGRSHALACDGCGAVQVDDLGNCLGGAACTKQHARPSFAP